MSYKHNIIKERFDIQITGDNRTFKAEFQLDRNAKYLIGLAITSDRDDMLFYRGSQKIELNDSQLFPERFESRLLMSGLNVPPDNRMITLGEIPTGNGKLEVLFNDTESPVIAFEEYRVSFYAFTVDKLENI